MTTTDPKRRWARWRDRVRERRVADATYRTVVAVVGASVLAVGILAIPYPGPGWAIVFLGLGILATEFRWARRLLKYAKLRYDRVMTWFRAQGLWVQVVGVVFTSAVVVATLWLIGAIAWGAALIGLDWAWLQSPIAVLR